MSQELISVIIPVYKVEDYLGQCLDSVLNQTYSNLEVILVDDGSPDNSGKICDRYGAEDNRIVVIHKENGGVSSARNVGIDAATGTYLMFLDSDDYLASDCIEKLYDNLKGCKISECGITYFDENKTWTSGEGQDRVLDWKSYLTETGLDKFLSYAVVWGKLYEVSLFKEIRFPLGRSNGEDEATAFKLVYSSGSVSRIYEPLFFYRQREMGASRNKITPKRVDDAEFLFQEKISYFQKKNISDMAIFYMAKKAVCFTSLYHHAETRALKNHCRNVCAELLPKFLWKKNVPLKYKFYVIYFLIKTCFPNQ